MKTLNSPLFEQYRAQLLRFISSKINNPQDAEDILADVFLKLMMQKKYPVKPVAWLFSVTRNCIIDYYRKQKPSELLIEDMINEQPDDSEFLQFSQCLTPMIQALNSNYQQVITLIDIQGLKQKQVAQQLEISLPALKSRVLRGRQKLHQMMQQCCPAQINQKGQVTGFTEPSKLCNYC